MKLYVTKEMVEDAKKWAETLADLYANRPFDINKLVHTDEDKFQARVILGADASRCETAWIIIHNMVQYHHMNYAYSLSEIEPTNENNI